LMGNCVPTRRTFAHSTGTRARFAAVHASPATACAGAQSTRPRTVSSRHLSHLLHHVRITQNTISTHTTPTQNAQGRQLPTLHPPGTPTKPSASPAQATRASTSPCAGKAPVAPGSMDVPTPALGTGHPRPWAPDAMGYLELISTVVASETTHPHHLLPWS
jgi:hypothetical protein